jgi:hypothetical protein
MRSALFISSLNACGRSKGLAAPLLCRQLNREDDRGLGSMRVADGLSGMVGLRVLRRGTGPARPFALPFMAVPRAAAGTFKKTAPPWPERRPPFFVKVPPRPDG